MKNEMENKMERQLKDILNTLYEGEALLEMALRRPVADRAAIVALARRKCFDIADLAARLPQADEYESAPHEPEKDDDAQQLFMEKIVPSLENAVASAQEREEEPEENQKEDTPSPAPYPSAAQLIEGSELEQETEQETEQMPEEEEEEEDEDALDELASDTEEEALEEASAVPMPKASPARVAARKPLAASFSINDKFRFRRELCGGFNAAWTSLLSRLESLNSLDEARELLIQEMGLDPANPEVKDMLAILALYYE